MREKSEEEVAVGEDDDQTDWKLNPLSHAEKLSNKAAPLRRVLETPEIRAVAERYQKSDLQANAAQRRYKRAAHLRLYAGMLATIIGAALLLPIETWVEGTERNIPAAVQYGCLCLSFVAALWLARALPFDSWMKARADAEDARTDLFRKVINAADPAPQPGAGELKLLPLKLEYFRRYQLDVQRRYYEGRGKQHQQAAGWTERWWIMSIVLSGVAGAVAIIAGLQVVVEEWHVSVPTWLAAANDAIRPHLPPWVSRAELAIGVIASALLSTSTSRSLMDLDERNASRYEVMAKNLDYYAGNELDQARTQATAGGEAAVRQYVEKVQDLLSGEHRQWILLAPIGGALASMGSARRSKANGRFEIKTSGVRVRKRQLVAGNVLRQSDFSRIAANLGVKPFRARKLGLIAARKAVTREIVETYWNGKETTNTARRGDFIVTSLTRRKTVLRDRRGNANTYVIKSKNFTRLYGRTDGENKFGKFFKSKSVVNAVYLSGGFEILAPWGERERASRGYLLQNGRAVYGNNAQTFEATYEVLRA